MNALGRHILVEFIGCDSKILNDVTLIENAMVHGAEKAGATVISSSFHHFSPFGVSGVVVIQESHLAIHTWPEYQYAAVDLFTCGESVDPWISFDSLKIAFKAQNHSAIEAYRGSLSLLKRTDFDISEEFRHAGHGGVQGTYGKEKIERSLWFTDKDMNQALSLRYNKMLFSEKSPFQKVRVFETPAYGKMLAIDNMVMCTERDEFHYHEMIVHPAMQTHGLPKNVLVIGGGDGGTIREVVRYSSLEKVTMVEIDDAVVRACKEYLPTIASAFNHPKVELKIADGIEFVKNAPSDSYDIVIVDGSDPAGPAEGLFTNEFYSNCKRVLRPNGVVVTQGESPMFHEKAFVELNECLKNVFGQKRVHTLLFHSTTYPTGMWSIQLACQGELHPIQNFNHEKAQKFAFDMGLRYYNADLHRSSFSLPTFVRRMLNEF